jgi:DNA helicase-2/ATP-dependent DNA helicase PcrA
LPDRIAILATAGAGKTTEVVKRALATTGGRVLLLTFTSENQRRLEASLKEVAGVIPSHIRVMGWFSFLINECIKPYQRALTGVPFAVRGLNFTGKAPLYAKNESVERYLDAHLNLFRDRVAQCAMFLNTLTHGLVAKRIEHCFRHILVDEVQDCVGYDLDVLDILLATSLNVVLVGDPRQSILATNLGSKNKKYRGHGLWQWVKERSGVLSLEERNTNHRCHAEICKLADSLFPSLPPSTSGLASASGHDGVFFISAKDVDWYINTHSPDAVLRQTKITSTLGLPATNIGLAKGATFNRVLIFPTKPMRTFLLTRDPAPFASREDLYVAVTRARFSVTFVLPEDDVSNYAGAGPGLCLTPTGAV